MQTLGLGVNVFHFSSVPRIVRHEVDAPHIEYIGTRMEGLEQTDGWTE